MRVIHSLRNWIFTVALLAVSTAVWANPLPGNLWFDEYGVGYLSDGGRTARLPSIVGTDPTGGVSEPVLTYFVLGKDLTAGDVLLSNPDGSWSDVIRFTRPEAGVSAVIYYSNASDSPRLLPADVHSMPPLMPGYLNLTVPETRLTVYEPLADQPGYGATLGHRYLFFGDFHSYEIPDRGTTLPFLVIGLIGILALRLDERNSCGEAAASKLATGPNPQTTS